MVAGNILQLQQSECSHIYSNMYLLSRLITDSTEVVKCVATFTPHENNALFLLKSLFVMYTNVFLVCHRINIEAVKNAELSLLSSKMELQVVINKWIGDISSRLLSSFRITGVCNIIISH